MMFISERVKLDHEILTVVFPAIKQNLLVDKIDKLKKSNINFNRFERFITLNGGYVI